MSDTEALEGTTATPQVCDGRRRLETLEGNGRGVGGDGRGHQFAP